MTFAEREFVSVGNVFELERCVKFKLARFPFCKLLAVYVARRDIITFVPSWSVSLQVLRIVV